MDVAAWSLAEPLTTHGGTLSPLTHRGSGKGMGNGGILGRLGNRDAMGAFAIERPSGPRASLRRAPAAGDPKAVS